MTTTFTVPNMPQINKLLGARYSVVLTKRFKATYGNRTLSQKVEFRRLPDKRNIEVIVKEHDGGLTKLHLDVKHGIATFQTLVWPGDEMSKRITINSTWGLITDLIN